MTCVRTLLLVLAFSSLKCYVQSNKICSFRDTECTTNGARKAFISLVNGTKGLNEPLDSITLAKLEGEYLSSIYKLSNVTLTGMNQCLYPLLRLNPDKFTYINKLRCPKLVLKFYYDIQGILGPVELDGRGLVTVTLNDYIILLRGFYEEYISEKDNKLHFYLVNYNLECECIGPVAIELNGPLHYDKEKDAEARNFVIKNGKEMEPILRFTLMPNLIGVLVKAIDHYLREVPIETIFNADE